MKIIGNSRIRGLVLATALSIGLGFGAHASADDVSYLIDLKTRTATSLGNLHATAINDAGRVVGDYYNTAAHRHHAFITGPNGVGMTDLGTLAGRVASYAIGINAAGQVVGNTYTDSSLDHVFITGPNGVGMTEVGALEGAVGSLATGVNDAGRVVGVSYHNDYSTPYPLLDTRAFITGPNGVGMTDFDTLNGSESTPEGINAAGQVVGGFNVDNLYRHAFITGPNGVGMTDLGTVGGGPVSRALGVNAAGQVVGGSIPADSHWVHAFITGPNGVGMTDLGTLNGSTGWGSTSWANDINDAGQGVGYSVTDGRYTHAFITDSSGLGMTDLNWLVDLPTGVVLTDAIDINNMGRVIVSAVTGVVPEPESYALMLAGLALMGVMARRKQEG